MSTNKTIDYLTKRGGRISEQHNSKNFGDSLLKISDGNVIFTFLKDKSYDSVDIQSKIDNEKFDIMLVKALLLGEKDLTKTFDDNTFFKFFESNYNALQDLFNQKNYSYTKVKLKELELKRAKQLFPKHYRE